MQSVRRACDAREVDYVLYTTTEVGDAERYVRQLCESSQEKNENVRIFACGGDGTVNECVNGAVGFDHAEIGVIPIGTGNDFVRNFGGAQLFFDVEAQLDANATAIDLIKYNDRYCVNMINIGFDCEVAARTAILKTNPLIPAKFAYICGILGEFIKKSGTAFSYRMDGQSFPHQKLLLSLFANGGYCGGGFFTAPLAELSDGLIDFCLVKDIPQFRFLSLVGPYKKGTHLTMKNHQDIFDYGKCRELELIFDQTRRICVDGEIETCDSLHLRIEQDAVRFVIPDSKTKKEKCQEASVV